VEQAEQPEPKRGRRKWPWLLGVVVLVGIVWAGVAWNSGEDEFAFLNDLHPRRVEQKLDGSDDLVGYSLIFPRDTADQVLPRLKSELVRKKWTPTDLASDLPDRGVYFERPDQPSNEIKTGAMYWDDDILGKPAKGECEVHVTLRKTWLRRTGDTIKGWFHLSP